MVTDTRRRARVQWTDTLTGAKGVYVDSAESPSMHDAGDGEFSTFWWEEGNGACDCNRGIYFLGAQVGESECGDGRFVVDLLEVIDHDDTVLKAYKW